MASKKRSGSSGAAKRARSTKKVYHVVANPPKRTRARRAAAAVGRGLGALGIGAALRSMLPMVAGALAAKLGQKKFGSGKDEDAGGGWEWKDYLIGGLGALAASMLSRHVMRSNPATAQKVLEGGLLILAFKLVTQEIVPMSDTAKGWLGDNAQAAPGYEVGDLAEGADGQTYVLGSDWRWRPVDAGNRLLGAADDDDFTISDALVSPGRLGADEYDFSDSLVSPGRLGAVPANWIKEADAAF